MQPIEITIEGSHWPTHSRTFGRSLYFLSDFDRLSNYLSGGTLKVRITVVVLFVYLTGSASFAGGGETTYNFLRNDVSARAAALGGSFIAVENDVNSLFYNPAGLRTLDGRQLSFGSFKHLMDVNSGYISYSQRYRDVGWIGAGINL